MSKILKFRPRKKEKSPSLKDVKPGELIRLFERACDKAKQKNPKQYYLFACQECGVSVYGGDEEVEVKNNVLIKGFSAELHKKAKIRAAEEEKTFKKLVENAVRAYLIRGDSKEEDETKA